jgi:raffinose/stachyose/melibiose transport system permease protein
MNPRRTRTRTWEGVAGIAAAFVIFVLPFIFIFLMAMKSKQEAALMSFSLPANFLFWENLMEVIKARDYMLLTAYVNSIIITVGSVTLLVVFGAMVGFVLQRRRSSWNKVIYGFVLAGLMIPPAVVPTIWVLQQIGLFKTISGMILIQVAYGLSFSVLLYRAFFASIPRELDEAAIIEGANPWQVFYKVIFPLLRPVTITNVLVQSVGIFNDFTNPLYYLPGKQNVTVQLTLYNFQSQFQSQFNLLFMNILLITIPPLIIFIFFNRQIVAGMTAGGVKG